MKISLHAVTVCGTSSDHKHRISMIATNAAAQGNFDGVDITEIFLDDVNAIYSDVVDEFWHSIGAVGSDDDNKATQSLDRSLHYASGPVGGMTNSNNFSMSRLVMYSTSKI